jgi:hypothetical protein
LPVSEALHRPQSGFEILAHSPLVEPSGFGQSHALQRSQSRNYVLVSRMRRIPANREMRGFAIWRLVPSNCPIQRGESLLRHFAALRFGDIELRAIPKLPGTQVLGDAPNAMLDVIAFETKRLSSIPTATIANSPGHQCAYSS